MVEISAKGTYHVAGAERLSKYDFALNLCETLRLPSRLIIPTSVEQAQLTAIRPKDLSLNTSKLRSLLNYDLPNVKEGIKTLGLISGKRQNSIHDNLTIK